MAINDSPASKMQTSCMYICVLSRCTLTLLCVNFSSADAKVHLKDLGIEDYNFKTGELWTYCGYKKRDGAVKIALHRGFDAVELVTSLNLGVVFKLCWLAVAFR